MIQKIYIVTAGEYSDYHIVAVFDDYQLAKNFVDAFKKDKYSYDYPEIETWPINPHKNQLAPGRKPFLVTMDKEGNVTRCEEEEYHYGFGDKGLSFTANKKLNVHCFAKDKQHAIKIANEKRGQILATNQWGKVK